MRLVDFDLKQENEQMAAKEAPKSEPLPIPIGEVKALLRYAAENSSAVPPPEGAPNFSARFLEEAMLLADSAKAGAANGTSAEKGEEGKDEEEAQEAPASASPPVTPEGLALAAYRRMREEQEDQASLVPKLYRAVVAFEAAPAPEKPEVYAEVLELYSKLTRLTAPVTGRSILDTPDVFKHLCPLYSVTTLLLFAGLTLQSVKIWLADGVAPEKGFLYWLSANTYVISHYTPFLWGGLGACVFLLKYLHDIAQIQAFDSSRLKGLTTRVALGAILGGIAVQLFDTTDVGKDGLPLQRDVFAFLAGLGVKAVYGAMEKVIQLISDKLNVESVRTTQMKGRNELKEAG